MNYAMNTNKIKILFTTSRKANVGSFLIRSKMMMNTPFSHVALSVYVEEFKSNLVFDATDVGVRATEYSSFIEKNEIIDSFELTLSEKRRKSVLEYIFSSLGKEFCFDTLITVWLVYIVKIPRRFKQRNKLKFTCSEFVYLVLQQEFENFLYELEEEFHFHPRVMNPCDLYWILHRGLREDTHKLSLRVGVLMDLRVNESPEAGAP